MKKKSIATICSLLILLVIVCTGCGSGDGSGGNDADSAKAISEIDVDLTAMSSTMVYSEVYNMVNAPQEYIGKTIKMTGDAASFYSEDEKTTYYACIIKDATACCSQGLEYVLQDPEDYPEDNEKITVVGEFKTYKAKDGTPYCTLENAQRVL